MPLPESLFQAKHKTFKSIVLDFITLKDNKNIEIEARIGKITNKITKKRIDFRIEHPIIFESLPNEFCFESGVEEKDQMRIKRHLVGEIPLTPLLDKVTICNKIRKIESTLTPETVVFQKKEKIKSMDIYLPGFKYDVRISVSMEITVPAKEFVPKTTQLCRMRKRESAVFGPFSFDFTKISKQNEKDLKSYEIELEIKDFSDGLSDFSNIVFALPVIKMEFNNTMNPKA